jgi:hypothetical protein
MMIAAIDGAVSQVAKASVLFLVREHSFYTGKPLIFHRGSLTEASSLDTHQFSNLSHDSKASFIFCFRFLQASLALSDRALVTAISDRRHCLTFFLETKGSRVPGRGGSVSVSFFFFLDGIAQVYQGT